MCNNVYLIPCLRLPMTGVHKRVALVNYQIPRVDMFLVASTRYNHVGERVFADYAAANPCPCGWRASGVRDCRCDDGVLARYAARISGPLLDRIDLHVVVNPVAWKDLDAPENGDNSDAIRARVAAARAVQARRGSSGGWRINAEIADAQIDAAVRASPEARRLLGRAVERYGLSARSARRVLKVARTIADLAGEEGTGTPAMAEALSYRGDTEPRSGR